MTTRSWLLLVGGLVLGCSSKLQEPETGPAIAATSTNSAVASAQTASSASATSVPAAVPALPARELTVGAGFAVRVEPKGPSQLEVSVRPPKALLGRWGLQLERTDAEGVTVSESLVAARTTSLHSAKPGAVYRYRFRVGTSDWSEFVEARTAIPTRPPPAPSSLQGQAKDAFSLQLGWQADASEVAGFEIERTSELGTRRSALVDPDKRGYLLKGRRPGSKTSYRVRAFNAAGVSGWSPQVEVTVPKLGPTPALSKTLGPCLTLPAVAPEAFGIGRSEIRPPPEELINEPAGSGTDRKLIGRANGCLRLLGNIAAQADISIVQAVDPEPYPLLSAILGAGQEGAAFAVLRFNGREYENVHQVGVCGEFIPPEGPSLTAGWKDHGDDPKAFQPPFEACQEEIDLGPQ